MSVLIRVSDSRAMLKNYLKADDLFVGLYVS